MITATVDVVDFQSIDRIGGVSPCYPPTWTGVVLLTLKCEQRTPPTGFSVKWTP